MCWRQHRRPDGPVLQSVRPGACATRISVLRKISRRWRTTRPEIDSTLMNMSVSSSTWKRSELMRRPLLESPFKAQAWTACVTSIRRREGMESSSPMCTQSSCIPSSSSTSCTAQTLPSEVVSTVSDRFRLTVRIAEFTKTAPGVVRSSLRSNRRTYLCSKLRFRRLKPKIKNYEKPDFLSIFVTNQYKI